MSSSNVKLGGKVNVSLVGRFQFKVNVDSKKFVLTNINSFVPFGLEAKDRMKFKTRSGEVDALIIDKVIQVFNPEDLIQKHNIKVLIQHPDVMIEGMPKEEWQLLVSKKLKKANPRFTIVNIDKVATVEFDEETELIEARGILYSKKDPLSKDRLIWLCSRFGLSYKTKITDDKRYRVDLIKKLDKFIQNSKAVENGQSSLQRFVNAIENIKNTEMYYYINELMAMGVVKDYSGIYKVGDRPVGATKGQVIEYYESNPDIFTHHKKLVLEKNENSVLE